MERQESGIDGIAAWSDEYNVMATLISPTRAVVPSSEIPSDARELRFYPGTRGGEIHAQVLVRNARRNVTC